jgi:hypothetical protein
MSMRQVNSECRRLPSADEPGEASRRLPAAARGGRHPWAAVVLVLLAVGWCAPAAADEHKLLPAGWSDDDQFGTSVSLSGNTAIVGAPKDDDQGEDSGSAYIDYFDGVSWVQQSKLSPNDGQPGDWFGCSVSISGDDALVGAWQVADSGTASGAAYVFHRVGASWSQQAKLLAADGSAGDFFGWSVSISGDDALIGAYGDDDHGSCSGSAYVFRRSGSTWSQQAKLTAADGDSWDYFGYSVTLFGDHVAVGARWDEDNGPNSGAAYVFDRNLGGPNAWGQRTKLLAADGANGDDFGYSLSLSGDWLLVGGPNRDDNGADSGAVYVFLRNLGGTDLWGQQAKLEPADGVSYDHFGISVSLSGGGALIGAGDDGDLGYQAGSAYAFQRSGSAWSEEAELHAGDGDSVDHFGCAVALSGDRAICGAYEEDDRGVDAGAAYCFFRSAGLWTEQAKFGPCDGAKDDEFGYSVGFSGDDAVIGAWNDDDQGSASGSAYVFGWDGASWSPRAKLTAGDGAAGDNFGSVVSISGDYALVGAPRDDDHGTQSGSAYIFYRHQGGADVWGQQAKLMAADGAANDYFGYSVSISGDFALVGAYMDDGVESNSGSAYVFYRNQGGTNAWGQYAKLTAVDTAADDCFGSSVSLSGRYAVVGAVYDDDQGSLSGSAYVFYRASGSEAWSQQAKLTAADGAAGDNFGTAVSTSGGDAVVGAGSDDDLGSASGSAYVFHRVGSAWSQQAKLTATDGAAGDRFGDAVGIAGDLVLVGSRLDNNAGGIDSGSACAFARTGSAWSQVIQLLAGDGANYDYFGTSVALSGEAALVGSFRDDDNGSNSGSAWAMDIEAEETVDCSYVCAPPSGIVPFATTMTITLSNLYPSQSRRIAARIDVRLASGGMVSNWRAGYTNVPAGTSYVTAWSQAIPASGALIGNNVFELRATDVTPSPYNQPPYPSSGDTAADACTVTADAP